MKITIQIKVFTAGLLLGLPPLLVATEVELSAGIEYYQWEEFLDDGSKLLSETGPRYVVALKGTKRIDSRWWQDFACRLYSGTVNYDGQTIQGGISVTSNTDYSGGGAEIGFLYLTGGEWNSRKGGWTLRFAVGVDTWRRGIRDGIDANKNSVAGYSESYISSYVSIAANYHTPNWYFSAGVMAPYYVTEEASITGNPTLHPVGQLSPFAHAEYRFTRQWSTVLEYDTLRYSKSDVSGGYYQPKSSRDTLGLMLRYRF